MEKKQSGIDGCVHCSLDETFHQLNSSSQGIMQREAKRRFSLLRANETVKKYGYSIICIS